MKAEGGGRSKRLRGRKGEREKGREKIFFAHSPIFSLVESMIGIGNLLPVGGRQIALRFPRVPYSPLGEPRGRLDGLGRSTNSMEKGKYRRVTQRYFACGTKTARPTATALLPTFGRNGQGFGRLCKKRNKIQFQAELPSSSTK